MQVKSKPSSPGGPLRISGKHGFLASVERPNRVVAISWSSKFYAKKLLRTLPLRVLPFLGNVPCELFRRVRENSAQH